MTEQLPENISTTYPDLSVGDTAHQHHHDVIHQRVNGLPDDTSVLETIAGAVAKVATHEADSTSVHGIANTSSLMLKGSLVFNVKDYGAVGDGTTDDTAAINAAIAATQSLASGIGVNGGVIYFPPGEYKILSTIILTRFAGAFVGAGSAGTSPAYASGSPPAKGNSSVLRWEGNNTTPMVKVLDSKGVRFSQLRFEGKDSSKPTYGIEFNSAGGSVGTNELLTVEDCYFGQYTWTPRGTNFGLMTNGIGFTGTNANNDQFSINRCQFVAMTGTGIDLPNTQSVWGSITDCVFGTCGKGISTSASFTGSNLQFDNNQIDLQVNSTARCNIVGFQSERSVKILDITNLGTITINGGFWLSTNWPASSYFVDFPGCTASCSITLNGVLIGGALASPTPKMRVTASGGGGTFNGGSVTVLNSFSDPNLFLLSSGPSDSLRVLIIGPKTNLNTQLYNETWNGISHTGIGVMTSDLSTTVPRMFSGLGTPEGVITALRGSMFLRLDGGAGTSLYVKESGTGNTGWIAK